MFPLRTLIREHGQLKTRRSRRETLGKKQSKKAVQEQEENEDLERNLSHVDLEKRDQIKKLTRQARTAQTGKVVVHIKRAGKISNKSCVEKTSEKDVL